MLIVSNAVLLAVQETPGSMGTQGLLTSRRHQCTTQHSLHKALVKSLIWAHCGLMGAILQGEKQT